jgi:hypothetical protein
VGILKSGLSLVCCLIVVMAAIGVIGISRSRRRSR